MTTDRADCEHTEHTEHTEEPAAGVATVLVADDLAEIRLLMRLALERRGHVVLEARTGTEALDLARRVRPAVAVLDQTMPGMTGLEVAAALASDPATAGIRVIMTSISVARDDAGAHLRRGVHAYLPKPFGVTQLQTCVEALLIQREGGAGAA